MTDRCDQPLGWRLKKLFVMQGAGSRIYSSVAEAIAAIKLMKPREATAAIAAVDSATVA